MGMAGLEGRVAVVTGGSGGIGQATARRLLQEGATVVLWDVDGAALARLAAELPGADTVQADLLDEAAVQAAFGTVVHRHGRVDILVNCVGAGGVRAPVEAYLLADWQRIVAINLTAPFLACKHAVPVMRRNGYGRIVNLSSTAGKDGTPSGSAYAAAKAGLMAFTKSLAREVIGQDIRVNCVTPAAIEGPLFDRMTPEGQRSSLAKIPMGRLGKADEIAALIVWLSSAECSFSTGAVFDASGGRSTY